MPRTRSHGFIKRVVMRFIAWREGAPTDARRDYEFTDWKAVRQFALGESQDVRRAASRRHVGRCVMVGAHRTPLPSTLDRVGETLD